MSHIKTLDMREHKGRIFFSTDLHGHYDLLHEHLKAVAFDSTKDILILGGDMCDRGPDSKYVLDYLNEPWVYCIQANHESMVIDAYEYPDDRQAYRMLFFNGGEWWYDIDEQTQKAIYETFKSLPLALEVLTPTEKIGIVHAQVPYNDWEQFKDMTTAELNWNGKATAQWARTNYDKQLHVNVKGVDRVLVGHTPTESGDVEILGNVWYCDAGSFFRDKINFIQLM